MSVHDVSLFGDPIVAARIAERLAMVDARKVLRLAIEDLFPGKIALVSSFGADSAVLLHMVSEIDRATPVVFVDTRQLFPETLAYRDELVARLRLTNVVVKEPNPTTLAEEDPEKFLWASNPDRCCAIRKVAPLAEALEGFDAWISGRKRFQAATRTALPIFEAEGDRIKVNPLANWSNEDLQAYFGAHDLPRHSLVAKGYLSIGCIPCTSMVRPGEDPRAGRWRGRGKVECGIHTTSIVQDL